MTIEFECEECGYTLRLRDDAGGKTVKCRNCSSQVQVPRGRKRAAKQSIHPLVYVAAAFAFFGVVVVGLIIYGISQLGDIVDDAQREVAEQRLQELPAGPAVMPTAPLQLADSYAPPFIQNGADLREEDPSDLEAEAHELGQRGDYQTAAQLQYWAVKGQEGHGQYNLACYLSRISQVDAAFYWLQRSGLEEGCDANWAQEDPDLANIRRDARWPAVSAFLTQANQYWQSGGHKETTLVMPQGVAATEPIPVIVGLHGMGSSAHHFMDVEFQSFANKHRIALVGVSGTLPRGRASFVWSEVATRDQQRVEDALKEVSDRVTIAPGKIVLMGFSQGAKMSAEIAVLDRQRYAGAIVLSPGGELNANKKLFTPGSAQSQVFVLNVGQGEMIGNKLMTTSYASLLKSAGGDVEHIVNAAQSGHSFPPNFDADFERWVTKILASR